MTFRAVGRSRPGRALRLLFFALVWLTAETRGAVHVPGPVGRQRVRRAAAHRAVPDPPLRGSCGGSSAGCTGRRPRPSGCGSIVDEPELTAEPSRPPGWPARSSCSARHAGPGDSFLLVHQLLSVYGRRPRVVMKATLQLDPSLDVMANRLPNVFISRRKPESGSSPTRSSGWPAGSTRRAHW